jgi:hypothetical protein
LLSSLNDIILRRNSTWASYGGNVVMPDQKGMLRRVNPMSAVSVE